MCHQEYESICDTLSAHSLAPKPYTSEYMQPSTTPARTHFHKSLHQAR